MTADPGRLLRLLQEATRAANEADDLRQAAQRALVSVCETTDWAAGHLLVPAADEPTTFVTSGVWYVRGDQHRFADLRVITEMMRFPPGAGLPGRVVQQGRPIWIPDVTEDPFFVRAVAGTDLGVGAAKAFPVRASSKEIIAILEFFSEEPTPPDEAVLEVMADVGTQLGRVADRMAARRELEQAAVRQREIIEGSAEAFVTIDEDGLVTDWNAAAERMFTLSRAEAVGRPIDEMIVPPRLRSAHRNGLARYLDTGRPHILGRRIEVPAWHPVNGEFPVELAPWVTSTGNGRQQFHAFLHDVSGRRAAERERDRMADLQRLLLANSEQAICGHDTEGRCTFANPAAAKLFGYPVEELVGSDMHQLVHHHRADGSVYPVQECPISRAISDGSGTHIDSEAMWRKDGSMIFVEYTCGVLREDDEVRGVVVTLTDVSDRLTADLALRNAYDQEREVVSRLRELDRVKSDFVATVSHELRTPLTSVTGYLELLTSGEVGELTADQQRTVATVIRNTERLRLLIEDLLTLSRIEAGTVKFVMMPVDLGDLVSRVCAAMRPQAEQRQQRFEVRVDDDLPPVEVDADQIRRALSNLVANAIKFTDPGGVVALHARRADGKAEVAIRDTGLGIEPDEVPQLFTRFFRGRSAMLHAIQGIGLGLTIAGEIVRGHQGRIDVDSAPGQGSTFVVSLPAVDDPGVN